MEELLRQAFQLGQQWVQDMNNDKEPTNFNDWYASDEVQEQVENCSIPAVISQRELLLDFAEYSENDKKSEHLDELVDNYLDSIKQ